MTFIDNHVKIAVEWRDWRVDWLSGIVTGGAHNKLIYIVNKRKSAFQHTCVNTSYHKRLYAQTRTHSNISNLRYCAYLCENSWKYQINAPITLSIIFHIHDEAITQRERKKVLRPIHNWSVWKTKKIAVTWLQCVCIYITNVYMREREKECSKITLDWIVQQINNQLAIIFS